MAANKFKGVTKAASKAVAVAGELLPRAPASPAQRAKQLHPAMVARLGKGRPAGVPNKFTKEVKQVIATCFDDIGGRAAFAKWASENRKDFYKLYSKLLPIQLQSGTNGNSINIYISPTEAEL